MGKGVKSLQQSQLRAPAEMITKRFIGILAVTNLITFSAMHLIESEDQPELTPPEPIVVVVDPLVCEAILPRSMTRHQMIDDIASRYKIRKDLARQIVDLVHEYQYDDFPRAHDLIALIGIESSFRPHAVSKLKKDPAVGLTQIRPKIWRHLVKERELKTVDGQIKYAAKILNHYYNVLQNKHDALVAYNIGITARMRGDDNPRYLAKYLAEYGHYYNNYADAAASQG